MTSTCWSRSMGDRATQWLVHERRCLSRTGMFSWPLTALCFSRNKLAPIVGTVVFADLLVVLLKSLWEWSRNTQNTRKFVSPRVVCSCISSTGTGPTGSTHVTSQTIFLQQGCLVYPLSKQTINPHLPCPGCSQRSRWAAPARVSAVRPGEPCRRRPGEKQRQQRQEERFLMTLLASNLVLVSRRHGTTTTLPRATYTHFHVSAGCAMIT